MTSKLPGMRDSVCELVHMVNFFLIKAVASKLVQVGHRLQCLEIEDPHPAPRAFDHPA